MIVKGGEKQQLEVKNCTISGFSLKTLLTANAVNVAATKTSIDLSLVTFKAVLHRAGQQFVLVNDLLLPLLIESSLRTQHFKYVHPAYTTFFFPVQTQTAVLPGIGLIPGIIDLGGVINLDGDDRIVMECYFPSNAISGTGSTTATTIDMDYIEGVGVEFTTPKIITMTVQANQTRLQAFLGDNIHRVSFINIDQVVEGVATMPILNAVFSSDKLNYSDNNYEIINKMLYDQNFTTNDALGLMQQEYILAEAKTGVPFQKTSLDLLLAPTLIANGKNFIVARQTYGDARILNKGLARKEKHDKKNLREVHGSQI